RLTGSPVDTVRARFVARVAVRGIAALGLALTALLPTACGRASAEPGVRTVEARIDGITCASCVPPLTASLRKHFKDAGSKVDDENDTATLRLDGRQAFSPADFQKAVSDVRMRVVDVTLEVCGKAAPSGSESVLDAGATRFRLRGDTQVPLDKPVCVS